MSALPARGSPAPPPDPVAAAYALRLGDDALVLSQRLAAWVARAPMIEEDVALANIALDLLGQARVLLEHAGRMEGASRDEDALAFRREPREFSNVQLVELPDPDFAVTVVRQLLVSAYQYELYDRLRGSTDPVLAGLASSALAEVAYHRDHAGQWVRRLGDGTDESRARTVAALELLWPYTGELFDDDAPAQAAAAAGIGVLPSTLGPGWTTFVTAVLQAATLAVPDVAPVPTGGRRGVHTEGFTALLAEMQYLHRAHPGAQW